MNVLDTSILIQIANETEQGKEITQLLEGQDIAIAMPSYYEFLRGDDSLEAEKFIESFNILEFDIESARQSSSIYLDLKAKGKMINELDILIAGICQSNNATLYTLNKDFEKISTLKKVII